MASLFFQRSCAVLFGLVLVAVVVASLVPPSALPDLVRDGWDKGWHAGAYAGVTALGLLARLWRPWFLVLGLALIGAGVEWAQSWTSVRQADPTDILANLAGIGCAVLVWRVLGCSASPSRRD